MKKSVLFILPFLLLTSCNSHELSYKDYDEDRRQKVENSINSSNSKEKFLFHYEPFENFCVENFSNFSFYTLFPKDSVYCELDPLDITAYKVGYDTLTDYKQIYFTEVFNVINADLKNMDLSSAGSDDYIGPSRETLQIQAVFYPSISDDKEYKMVIDYCNSKRIRVKLEGSNTTFGYIYSYCRTDISEYYDIFMNLLKTNLIYHGRS